MGHEGIEGEVSGLDAEMESLLGDDKELGELAVAHDRLRGLESKIEGMKKELSQRIVARMDSMGVDSVKANGRRLGFKTTRYFGVADGHESDLKDFIEAVAPECLIPASTNIKKALDAWLDRNPNQPVPPFISVTETRSLVNAKA